MAKEYAKSFYSSKAWQDCRNQYAARRKHLCENCMAKGVIKAGEIVHHVIEIDAVNINRPEITLNWENLRLLCRECHAEEHGKGRNRRYIFGENGEIITK